MNKLVTGYIRDALRLCGQTVEPGRPYSPEQETEVLGFFNQLLDSWNSVRPLLYTVSIQLVQLTSNQYIYTIGPGGDLDIPRPQEIQDANVIYQTSPNILRLPLKVIDDDEWAAIRVPDIFAIPRKLYYDGGYSQDNPQGLAKIYLWPGPQGNYQLELFTWELLNSALEIGDTLYAPPGYPRALTYVLAAEIVPLYKKNMNQAAIDMVLGIAKEARNNIESLNAPNPKAAVNYGLGNRGGFNWKVSLG